MNIILIDDEAVALNALKRRMDWETYGFEQVFTANSMPQAQQLFSEQRIEVMLCDIEMPWGSGLELFEWVKAHYPAVECVFITCHPEYDYMRKALQLGSADYVLKPIDYAELDGILRALIQRLREKQTAAIPAPMLEELRQENEEKRENVKIAREGVNTIRYRIQSNTEKLDGMRSQRDHFEKAGREYAVCAKLYNLVKGQTGNGKITLEQYIQAAGFDGIIRAANRRLMPMSDQQYELYRQEDSLGKRSNTFLDLEVKDNYTGRRRPVGNLSGGESFKASLSLALGLSDTVSSNLGGIQMDALFVDEGFGTLDRRSIDNAMDTLLHLSGSGKLVGVISHREELIENIPQQIRVSKTKEGSRITVETGL